MSEDFFKQQKQAAAKRYREAHPDRVKAIGKRYREENSERIALYKKIHAEGKEKPLLTAEKKAANKEVRARFKEKFGTEGYAQYQRDAIAKAREKDPVGFAQRELERQRKREQADPEKYRAIRKETVRRLKEKDPAYFIKATRKALYGLSVEAYDALVTAQEGRCAICRDEVKLCVDHNHTTKKTRQLLCARCNHGIGHFRESIERLQAAIDYLKRHTDV